jgi:carboxyl-terminal processing protease
MNRRFQLAVVASSACLVVLLLFGAMRGSSAAADDSPYTQLGVYSEVLSRIRSDYVEEPDIKGVTLGAIAGLLESLDRFASYLSADQYKQYLRDKDAGKAWLGLLLARRAGSIEIVDSVPGSPADKAGLSTGDFIEAINNVATRDMPLAFAELLLQGQPGTSVEIAVLRLRQPDPQKVVLVRAPVAYPETASRLITGQGEPIGLVGAFRLDAARVREIAAKIGDLEKQGAKRLILDLRRCATGAPEDGVALANLFMDRGLIAYTQGQKSSRQDYSAASSRAITKLPLVVLTNRGTAGAAEVAAAALLESKRAQVVGERTYGNAAVRKAVTLGDGSAVILAVAKYYTPSGKAIQDGGVTPSTIQLQSADIDDGDEDAPPQQPARAPDSGDPILKMGIEVLNK